MASMEGQRDLRLEYMIYVCDFIPAAPARIAPPRQLRATSFSYQENPSLRGEHGALGEVVIRFPSEIVRKVQSS